MTQEDTAKALKLLTDTEALTGTDLSTIRWAVQRHADVMAAGQDAHTTRAEQRLVPGTTGPKEAPNTVDTHITNPWRIER